jgi:RHS repeat-associated protein
LAIDEVLARYGSSGNRTLLTDALMSVIAQANDDQSVGNFYAYSPYGQSVTLGPDGGNDLQYAGLRNDGTGLYYAINRYFDPILKQWISEDPIGLAGGINLRAYVSGDPVNLNDPEGLLGSGGGGSASTGGSMPGPIRFGGGGTSYTPYQNCMMLCDVVVASPCKYIALQTPGMPYGPAATYLGCNYIAHNICSVRCDPSYVCTAPYNSPNNPNYPQIPPLAMDPRQR